MKSLSDTYKLNNGAGIPCVGFGTWQTPDGKVAVAAIQEALAAGYRHIDTAAAYGNEGSVGRAVRESGLKREEIFITTKLPNPDHGYEATHRSFNESMKKLGLEYLDLYLVHWPNPVKFRSNWKEANAGTWKAFEELYKAGRIRSIGVSNFMPRHLEALMETAQVEPMVNQIRLCPGETDPETSKYCKARGIILEAYSPLGTGIMFDVPEMKAMAAKYKKSIAQVCIRWSLQMGFLPLPKSVTASRIRENADVFGFELSPADALAIASLKDYFGAPRNPDTMPF
jgi:diketogulonate reductase-like aldo/keto reductase